MRGEGLKRKNWGKRSKKKIPRDKGKTANVLKRVPEEGLPVSMSSHSKQTYSKGKREVWGVIYVMEEGTS